MLIFTHFKFKFSEKATRNWKKMPPVLAFTQWMSKHGGYFSNCVAFSQCLIFNKRVALTDFSVFQVREMFPSLNNSKHNKNVIGSYGLFIMWAIFYIAWVLGHLSRVGWITLSNATMYFLLLSAVLLFFYPQFISWGIQNILYQSYKIQPFV